MREVDGTITLRFARTLYGEHMGECVDSCIRALRAARGPSGQRPRERRFAIACVVHGYAAIEAAASIMKFELYDHEQGDTYIKPAERSVALEEVIAPRNWRRLALETKYRLLLEARRFRLEDDLAVKIGDVRELRHLLAHGAFTPAVARWTVGSDGVERQAVVGHFKTDKFKELKFSAADELKSSDAVAALRVVASAISALRSAFDYTLDCTAYEVDPQYIMIGDPVDVMEPVLKAGNMDTAMVTRSP